MTDVPLSSDAAWHVREVELAEIGSLDPVEFTRRFREGRPVLLVYRLRELGWVGIAKCAPVGWMLWATELGGEGQHDDERRWVDTLLQDRATYDTFRRELDRAGIHRRAVPWDLLGPYCRRGAYFGLASLAFRPVAVGEFRVSGLLLPADQTDALVKFYERQLQQFAEYAFWRTPEGRESDPDRIQVHRVPGGYLDARLWRHPLRSDYTEEARQLELTSRITAVHEVIHRISGGAAVDLNLHYHDAVRPSPMFILDRRSAGYPTCRMDWELYSLRARLVRLLGWPNMYRSLMAIPGIWGDLEAIGADTMAGGLACDIASELRAFKAEMEQRYPVLRERPLARLASA